MLNLIAKVSSLLTLLGLRAVRDRVTHIVDFILSYIGIPPLAVRVNDFTLHGYFRHARFLRGITTRGFEPLAQTLFTNSIQHDTVVVDGGAHVGLYTLLAARCLRGHGKIFAFEPDPFNFRTLMYNVTHSKYDRGIQCIAKALSNRDEAVTFYRGQSSLSGSIVNRRDVVQDGQITITTTTLDTVLEDITIERLVIKLDLEGAEPLALEGMKQVLETIKPITLFLEINPRALEDNDFDARHLVDQLQNLNFDVRYIDEECGRVVPVADAIHRKGNLYCTRRAL